MLYKFYLRNLRIAPRKVRSVAGIIKGLDAGNAALQLQFQVRRPAGPLLKLLKSGIASAEKNFNINRENLFVRNVIVDEGPMLKRFMPRAMGRAAAIHKKTSHVTLILESKTVFAKKAKMKKKEKQKAPQAKKREETRKTVQEAPKIIGLKPQAFAKTGRKIFRRKAIG